MLSTGRTFEDFIDSGERLRGTWGRCTEGCGLTRSGVLWTWAWAGESHHAGRVRQRDALGDLSAQASRRERVLGRVNDEYVDTPDSTHRLFCADN
jgi:hypothetical protein